MKPRRVSLTPCEIWMIVEALDSHEYWQLTDGDQRNDGFSQVDDGEDADIDLCRALHKRLSRLVPKPKEESHVHEQPLPHD